MRAIGLMSGTSMDGIDVALIETDGERAVEPKGAASFAYGPDFRARLVQAMADAKGLGDRTDRPGCLASVERELTDRHAAAVEAFLADRRIEASAIDVIGFHGQTVLHALLPGAQVAGPGAGTGARPAPIPGGVVVAFPPMMAAARPASRPQRRLTVQLGDGPRLAHRLGIDVVYDLRAADCAAGGEGAPLVPIYHRALASRLPELPAAFLNIGGVANVTWIGADDRLIAFDTGPGNALLDDWALRHTGRPRDEDGRLALSGRVDAAALAALSAHPYFAELPPKSLDRGSFTLAPVEGLSPADGAATLTAFTAAAVRRALAHMPEAPQYWAVAGGGRRNRALMQALAGALETAVVPVEALGLDGDGLEAEAFAYLAVRSLKGLPITFPGTTGVPAPLTGGVHARGR